MTPHCRCGAPADCAVGGVAVCESCRDHFEAIAQVLFGDDCRCLATPDLCVCARLRVELVAMHRAVLRCPGDDVADMSLRPSRAFAAGLIDARELGAWPVSLRVGFTRVLTPHGTLTHLVDRTTGLPLCRWSRRASDLRPAGIVGAPMCRMCLAERRLLLAERAAR